ncbi:anti-sigma factor domain-containing protein [Heyndrickxia camelliae]|uniref:RsgI N-terminal anti-sigma domain-containing protein n=1 Tax=Heyndrickxia camelliae TaxID=1707093 RepID=A0A2N3LQE7_9BACI|nr:anti-sigma factor domain-containing protein [Heyndrickxia camelliae]PKR86851.1 hypothetical protein CWO92_02015 [Heyndrickxia camelliae]
MRKGVILEIKKRYLVMLTAEGEFVKGAKPHDNLQIGEEIVFNPYVKKLHFPLVPVPAKIGGLALVSALIICALVFNVSNQNKAYAYVSIDANPSVELVLNKNLQVIRAKALNQDGQKVLSKVNVADNQDFEYIAKQVLSKSKSLGYLDKNANVIIASVIKDQHKQKNKRLEEKVQKLAPIAKIFNANVKVVNATIDEREDALKSGVSTGTYVVKKEQTKLEKRTKKEQTKLEKRIKTEQAKQEQTKNMGNNQTNKANKKAEKSHSEPHKVLPKKNEPIKKNTNYRHVKPEKNIGQQKKNEKRLEHEMKTLEKEEKRSIPWAHHRNKTNPSNNGKWNQNHMSNHQDHHIKDRNNLEKNLHKKIEQNKNHYVNHKENKQEHKWKGK